MKTKSTKRPSSSKRRSHGKKAGSGRIGARLLYKPETEFADMECPYVAVVLLVDSERTRSTYKTADEAYNHAVEKIGSIARAQNKRLTFAICKVVEIIEPVSPNVARRAPKKGDGTPRFKIEDSRLPDFMLHPNCRSVSIGDLARAYGANDETVNRITSARESAAAAYGAPNWRKRKK